VGAGAALRSYLPAPPPVSIRRAVAQPAPPVPAVGRGSSAASATSATASATSATASATSATAPHADAVVRRSFLDATAGLFRSADGQPPAIRRFEDGSGGLDMPDQLPTRMSVVGPGFQPFRGTGDEDENNPFADVSVLHDDRRLDELVDRVVERIEQRVVDELERRGRRHTPGAF
jgi:hypothetical protein